MSNDDCISRWLARLDRAERAINRTLLEEPLVSEDSLGADLSEYTASLAAKAARLEFIDVDTAYGTAKICGYLLKRFAAATRPEKKVIQAAIRYFILEEDGESDAHSIIGFDDDLRVALAAAEVLGISVNGEGN